MVPCYICGNNTLNGWVCGFFPTPEKHKLGLCKEHDTPENREMVEKEWEKMMVKELSHAHHGRKKSERKEESGEKKLAINFLDGGTKIVTCSGYQVMDGTDILTLTVNGELEFYPLQHIRSFRVI